MTEDRFMRKWGPFLRKVYEKQMLKDLRNLMDKYYQAGYQNGQEDAR